MNAVARPADLPHRPALRADDHKGDRGRVLIVAGSPGLSGAAFLAGAAAVRAGAGLVTVAVPESIHAVLEAKTTAAMTVALPATDAGTISPRALEGIVALAARADAVALGPGIGRHPATDHLVRRLVGGSLRGAPVVIDADGLNALAAADPDAVLDGLATDAVLTPHPGEMARLLGEADGAGAIQARRAEVAAAFAARHRRVTLLLKGRATIVAQGDRRAENGSGGPALATGGSGDVLTGLIAALLGRGLAPFDAARLAAWIHGRAGDLAAVTLGAEQVTAPSILDHLPRALREDDAVRA